MMTAEALAYYYDHPVQFVQDIIRVNPDPDQADILQSLVDNQMTSARSGHGIGKSAVEAWAIIWFIMTRPYPKIPCTAPTQHQLFDILWAEIAKWRRNNPALEQELVWTKERLYMRSAPEDWFAAARTASKPDALQGFHAEHVLFVIDEASGVADNIFEPILGAMSTKGSRLLMCGNPTQLSGFFFDSHNKHRSQYKTFRIDGRNSKRVDPEYVRKIINMYGEDSDVFRVRVAGDFPLAENDVFIPLPLVEKSVMTEYKERKPKLIDIGCDVARFGDDKTVIGYRTDEKFQFYSKRNGQDTMKTADRIIELADELERKYKPEDTIPVKIDDSGVGGGVVDRLRQVQAQNPGRLDFISIFPVHFGVKLSKHKYYDDSTTYMMAVVKKLLMPHDEDGKPKEVELILPNDDDLIAQLSGRKYSLQDNAKIRVESKKVMKARGMTSPDEADCLLLTCLPVKRAKRKRGAKRR